MVIQRGTPMNVTEVLITGYDGKTTVFAASLVPGRAKMIFATEDGDGQSTVDSVFEAVTPAFDSLLDILRDLGALNRPSAAVAAK
jgi:hypothetical protein